MSDNICNSLFNTLINRLSSPQVKKQINEKIVTPILEDVNDKYYYHFVGIVCLLVTIIILLFVLISKMEYRTHSEY